MNPDAVLFLTMYEMLIGMLKSSKYRGFIADRLNGWRRKLRRLCATIVEVMRGEKQEYGRHPSGPTKMAVFGSFLVWKGPCWYWWPSIYVRAHRN